MEILQIIPELLVEEMSKTVNFYKKILGFKSEVTFPKKDPVFVQIGKDNVHLMLYKRNEFEKEIPKLKNEKMGGSAILNLKAKKIADFYKRINNKVNVIRQLYKTDYGSLEFTITDCNGYLIAFSENLTKK